MPKKPYTNPLAAVRAHQAYMTDQSPERRLARAEATLARVRGLPARWRSLDDAFGTGEGDELLCADELEAALADP